MSIFKMLMTVAAAAVLLSGCVSDSSSSNVDAGSNAHPECAKQFANSADEDGVSRDIGGQHACF